MNALFQTDSLVIKRKGLSTDKLRVFSASGDFLMYAEQKVKWTPPFTATIRVYADDGKLQEILTASDAGGREYDNFLEVTDTATGQSVGGIGLDMNFIKEGFKIMDSTGALLAEIKEKSTGRSLARQLSSGFIAQKLGVFMGDEMVAEMNQKHALIGNHLHVNLTPGASGKLDPRLVVAAAIFVASHQAKEDME